MWAKTTDICVSVDMLSEQTTRKIPASEKIMVRGIIFETCGWKALFGVFKLREFIYHVGGGLGDHWPWGPASMEKPAFPHGWGLLSLAREEALKTSVRLGALSIPVGISCELFPESAAVLCFAFP